MQNHPNRAASGAMPSLTRRLFLRGAAIVAPMAAVPALAAAAPHYAEENPALLALVPELDRTSAEMVATVAAYSEALRIGRQLWPKAPEEITYKCSPYDADGLERDIEGWSAKDAPGVQRAKYLRWDLDRIKRWRKMTPEREEERSHVLSLYEKAQAYEAACEHAKEASGIEAARERRTAAVEALRSCLERIHAEKAVTIAGVQIKAKAVRSWESAPRLDRLFNVEGQEWASSLARAVLKITEA